MKSRTSAFFAVLSSIVLASSLLAQSQPLLTLEKVMTGEQLRTTGVEGLTPVQRAALDRWLSDYTMKIIQLAQHSDKAAPSSQGSSPSSYAGSSGGHWIKSKADNGAIVVLEDGSMWEINSFDRIDTVLWLPITNVTVLRATSPVGDYKYLLINTDDGEKALAKYLGKQ